MTIALWLALSVASGAFIITSAKISRPARIVVAKRVSTVRIGPGQGFDPWKWLHELLSCPFCVAVWLSLGATGIYRPYVLSYWRPLDFIVTALAIATASMLGVLIIRKAVQ